MSMDEMVEAFNQIRARHNMKLDEMLRRLTWFVDNEVPDYADEIEQDYSEDIVTDPRDPDRRFYYLDQRDFELFRILWAFVLEVKKQEEKQTND